MSTPALPLVLITNAVPAAALAPLDGIATVIQGPAGGDLMPRDEVLRLAPGLAGIINQAELRVDAELLARAPQLRIVANVSIGVDNLDLPAMTSRGVYATNTPDAFVDSTADFTLGLLLTMARRIHAADRHVRAGEWRGFQPGVWDGALLSGKTLGIIGYGAIGRAVARRATAFGLRIVHYQRTPDGSADYADLESLLAQSDFVTLHLPLNAESRGLMSAARLARMKRGACLINAARGLVVDEAALVAALQSGHLAGAALDVFENEPRVHPGLCALPNVVLTPHIAGGTRESRHHARHTAATNVASVLRGLPPVNRLNFPVWPHFPR